MQFTHIINAALSQENDRPLMQKEVYPVGEGLQQYLQQYQRDIALPIDYKDLFHYRYTNAIKDANGKHTHWEDVIYTTEIFAALEAKLIATYRLLKQSATNNFRIQAIHFCEFANSMPFRIIIANSINQSEDYFYIKASDASRIYGLELEQLLSPNTINFLYHQQTLVEEHIEGIPGDTFIANINQLSEAAQKNLAEEFIRFNERCFARLLGDMRSYNFVVIPHSNANTFRLRAIDFDQQCYEGRLQLYLPQFYKENYGFVQMALELLGSNIIESIRTDERQQLAFYTRQRGEQLMALFNALQYEEISENYKVVTLRRELGEYFSTTNFAPCSTMSALVRQQLTTITKAV